MKPIFTDHGKHLVGAIVFAAAVMLMLNIFAMAIRQKEYGWSIIAFVFFAMYLAGTIAETRALLRSGLPPSRRS